MDTPCRRFALAASLALVSSLVVAGARQASAPVAAQPSAAEPGLLAPNAWAARWCRHAVPAHGATPDLCQVAFGAP